MVVVVAVAVVVIVVEIVIEVVVVVVLVVLVVLVVVVVVVVAVVVVASVREDDEEKLVEAITASLSIQVVVKLFTGFITSPTNPAVNALAFAAIQSRISVTRAWKMKASYCANKQLKTVDGISVANEHRADGPHWSKHALAKI